MSSRCCTLPHDISRRSSWPHKGLHGQWTFPSRVHCLPSSYLWGLSGKRWSHVTGASVNGTTHRKPHVVPDFLTVSSKTRGKAVRKHVCCAIWLSRGAGIGGEVIEDIVSIVSISAPPCGSRWMDNIVLGKAKYKAWEGLEDQVYLQVHFTAMMLKPPQICFHGRFWPAVLVQLRCEVLLHHSALWHLFPKDKGGWTHKATPGRLSAVDSWLTMISLKLSPSTWPVTCLEVHKAKTKFGSHFLSSFWPSFFGHWSIPAWREVNLGGRGIGVVYAGL